MRLFALCLKRDPECTFRGVSDLSPSLWALSVPGGCSLRFNCSGMSCRLSAGPFGGSPCTGRAARARLPPQERGLVWAEGLGLALLRISGLLLRLGHRAPLLRVPTPPLSSARFFLGSAGLWDCTPSPSPEPAGVCASCVVTEHRASSSGLAGFARAAASLSWADGVGGLPHPLLVLIWWRGRRGVRGPLPVPL